MINRGQKHPISLLAAMIAALAASGTVLAADEPAAASGTATESTAAPTPAADTTAPAAQPAAPTDGAAPAPAEDKAREALKQKSDDATTEKNLEQVFKAAEKTYSMLKAGSVSLNYGVDYSYFRDSRIDIALSENSSQITRFRVEEDAQNTISNDLSLDYGVWDNLTFNMSLPLLAKFDNTADGGSGNNTVGLGDVSFGARWQPFPLKRGVPTTTLFATLSTATGDSPYKINPTKDLSTGKGYYALSAGGSFSKVMDPVVLFASGSYSFGVPATGLNQRRGDRNLQRVEPGSSLGVSMGMAYALNYDISLSGSLQVSYSLPTKFHFENLTDNSEAIVKSADQITSTINMGLSLRTSPKRIVNINFGFGLTEDSPDLILGFNVPIDITGFTTGGE